MPRCFGRWPTWSAGVTLLVALLSSSAAWTAPGQEAAPPLPSPPVLHAHRTATRENLIRITGTSQPNTEVEISSPLEVWNVPVINGHFDARIDLAPGQINALFFTSINSKGTRSAPATTSIIQDTDPPALFIDFPSEGDQITTTTTDVAGRVGDHLSGFMGLRCQ